MTLYRPGTSVEALLLDALRLLSDQDIRDATGKTREAFRKVTQGVVGFRLEDAAKLDAVLELRGHGKPFHAYYEALVGNVQARLSLAAAEPVPVGAALLQATAALGRLAQSVTAMDADGRRDPHELQDVEAKARALIAEGQRVLAAISTAEANVFAFRRGAA